MPTDLNKMVVDIQKGCSELDNRLKKVFGKYEDLYREANRHFVNERTSSGSIKGLEDFYHMVQMIRRNRDVVGSLVRGVASLRSLKEFTIIEEDVPERAPAKKPRKKRTVHVPEAQSEHVVEETNG